MRPSHSFSIMRRPRFQEVCKETFLSLTFPFQDPGLMWSALSGISFDSCDMVGSLSRWGERSHWGYFARIFATSVVPERRETSCKMSKLASFPTIILRLASPIVPQFTWLSQSGQTAYPSTLRTGTSLELGLIILLSIFAFIPGIYDTYYKLLTRIHIYNPIFCV